MVEDAPAVFGHSCISGTLQFGRGKTCDVGHEVRIHDLVAQKNSKADRSVVMLYVVTAQAMMLVV